MKSCFCSGWMCSSCIVAEHKTSPFHRIVKWDENKKFCEAISLQELGLVVRLQTTDGISCTCSDRPQNCRPIEVLHTNGVHNISYIACTCGGRTNVRSASPEQLMTNALWPATYAQPEKAYTFQLLQHFDTLNLFGYINIKQFLDGIARIRSDDNSEVSPNYVFPFLPLNTKIFVS